MRNLNFVNKALLFNQAWRIHKNKESLINQIYVAKYKKDPIQMVMDNEAPKNSSYAFRSLLKASLAFKDGMYKKLGNGRTIRIDKDKWHPSKMLNPKIRETHEDRANFLMVTDLIGSNKEWKSNIIWKIFPT